MGQNERQWFIIHTYSGYEDRVKTNLEHRIESMDVKDKIFQVVVPTEDEMEIKDGQRRTVARKIFPGYIMVEMVMDEESWHVVRNTPGVTGIVSTQDDKGKIEPVPLDEGEVESILKQMESKTPRVRTGFDKGQSIRIVDGPFIDFIGVVDDINEEKGKIKVMVSFFGRETPVELDFLQVERL
ncbi:MAG: transcription termination/antitermination protein NusG [Dehalococcoidia bacterium]